jgi:hypothetical protein
MPGHEQSDYATVARVFEFCRLRCDRLVYLGYLDVGREKELPRAPCSIG